MTKIFLTIYDFFERHRPWMWVLLGVSIVVMSLIACRLRLQTDIMSFLPDSDRTQDKEVLADLRLKDRIIVMFSAESDEVSPDDLIAAADVFETTIWQQTDSAHILCLDARVDMSVLDNTLNFIYRHIPLFVDSTDYVTLDSVLQPDVCLQRMTQNYVDLLSPMGVGLQSIVLRDPLGLGAKPLAALQNFNQFEGYSIYDDRLFSDDYRTLYLFIDSPDGGDASPLNNELTTAIEKTLQQVENQCADVTAECYGVPLIATYNARQIQRDLMVTLNVALLVIVLLVLLAFRRKRTVLLLIVPVIYGALFAAACIVLIQGVISAIAIGTGAVVLGVALSYSVHVVAHAGHSKTARQIIEELATPLTIGSLTTIGAFIGLQFTSSPLLQDFGLFAACSLVGTMLFCLIFLPHCIVIDGQHEKTRTMQLINRLNNYPYDKNRWLVGILAVIVVVTCITCGDVRFNYDMMQLCYQPPHLEQAGRRLQNRPDEDMSILLVSHAQTAETALQAYSATNAVARAAADSAKIEKYMSAATFLPPKTVQKQKIAQWNDYWTAAKRHDVENVVRQAARQVGFADDAFDAFFEMLADDYTPTDLSDEMREQTLAFSSLVEQNDSAVALITQVWLDNAHKKDFYRQVAPTATVVDQSFFIAEVARSINDDFNLILGISSLLIFVVLLISYGRIELAVLAFLPMCLSWFIILGFMAIFGIEFNIVNIILSTFIFGIGDDFSIFVLDGLCSEYRMGKKMLPAHKTAIFFSALMTVIGMGALLFAKHPAIHSLALVSLLGIIVVVLVSYILQPLLFRWLVTAQTDKGGLPHTVGSLLRSLLALLAVVLCCLLLDCLILILLLCPCRMPTKRRIFRLTLQKMALWSVWIVPGLHIHINRHGENFKKPAIIIANHQSMIDLLIMFSLSADTVITAKAWVMNNPLFALIARFAGFIDTSKGMALMEQTMNELVAQQRSLVIFPEGTRSDDLEVQRFHKGAFFLAEKYRLDIVPIALYGTGNIYRKGQLYVAKGTMVAEVLPRIACTDERFGCTYQERAKNIRRYIAAEYDKLRDAYDTMDNAYYRMAFADNYVYKEAGVERMERRMARKQHYYRWLDALVPRQAAICETDCGYGEKTFALALLSKRRTATAFDTDAEKVAFAAHGTLPQNRARFVCADARIVELPPSDVFIVNAYSEALFAKCADRLCNNGKIIVMKNNNKLFENQMFTITENQFAWICEKK
ncbi:MAG: 1-acyl-sn-glycerol-3-phosphate acyltransferase [Paludibacteraceae bacterium]